MSKRFSQKKSNNDKRLDGFLGRSVNIKFKTGKWVSISTDSLANDRSLLRKIAVG